MHIRDAEIKRLIYYAKSLGAKVTIRDYNWEHSGEVQFDPKYLIKINKKFHSNKTQIIMTLLHELAHLKYAILNNSKFSDSEDRAWELQEANKKIPKKLRKSIVDFELKSLELMTNVASEMKLKIPMWKVLKQKEQDQFVYRFLGEHGRFPDLAQEDEHWKKLGEKYKK